MAEARGAREIIVVHLKEADKLLNSAHLKHIQGINQAMLDCLGQKRDHSSKVSNLGVSSPECKMLRTEITGKVEEWYSVAA
jgi:hypothetical protein